jgi:uncharacterized protein YndB with AHSA1/START domain
MEGKMVGMSFDLEGTYIDITPPQKIHQTILADGRNVAVDFIKLETMLKWQKTFEAETQNL